METLNKVKEFMQAFQPGDIKKPFQQVESNLAELRLRLLLEELFELAEGLGSESLANFNKLLTVFSLKAEERLKGDTTYTMNRVAVLDALTDLQYVLDGAYLAFGLSDLKKEAFDIVHENNMTKCFDSLEEADNISRMYENNTVIKSFDRNGSATYVVLRKDGKVLKPASYKPVDLSPLVIKLLAEHGTAL